MPINTGVVRSWLQQEGIYAGDQPAEGMLAQWAVRVPIDPQQSINMSVGIPKAKADEVDLMMNVIPADQSQQVYRILPDERKPELLRAIAEELLRTVHLFPIFGQMPDGRLTFSLVIRVYQDQALQKGRLMDAVRRLQHAFLLYDLFSPRLFKQFASSNELLRP